MTGRFRLRVERPGAEPELRCPKCGDWLAIISECWYLNRWDECRACHNERMRLWHLMKRREDEAYRADENGRSLRYRKWLRDNAPQYVAAYDRERRARKAAAAREARRAA